MKTLIINPRTGIAGDMFFSAILDIIEKKGIKPELELLQEFLRTYGEFKVENIEEIVNKKNIRGKRITTKYKGKQISYLKARHLIDSGIKYLEINKEYALIARRALEILINAETKAHKKMGKTFHSEKQLEKTIYRSLKNYSFPDYLKGEQIRIIGYVESPYDSPPLQTQLNDKSRQKVVKIVIDPELEEGLKDLQSFEKIWVISYLHKSRTLNDPIVFPPWDEKANPRGVFATRSPHRPTPIGLSKAEIIDIKNNIIILKTLDLIDGTPIIDIKPVLSTVDLEPANNGWVDSKHLEEHKEGIPHIHDTDIGHLHEAADIVFDILGAVYLLQKLKTNNYAYISPLFVGDGKITFSHGTMDVPAPATREILISHKICWEIGPIQGELVTPTGASILAALKPKQTTANRYLKEYSILIKGYGWGHKNLEKLYNYLEIYLAEQRN